MRTSLLKPVATGIALFSLAACGPSTTPAQDGLASTTQFITELNACDTKAVDCVVAAIKTFEARTAALTEKHKDAKPETMKPATEEEKMLQKATMEQMKAAMKRIDMETMRKARKEIDG